VKLQYYAKIKGMFWYCINVYILSYSTRTRREEGQKDSEIPQNLYHTHSCLHHRHLGPGKSARGKGAWLTQQPWKHGAFWSREIFQKEDNRTPMVSRLVGVWTNIAAKCGGAAMLSENLCTLYNSLFYPQESPI